MTRWVPSLVGGALFLAAAAPLAAQRPNLPANYPQGQYDEQLVPAYRLPDPLVMLDGRRVRNTRMWRQQRRPEILRLFETHVYGRTMVGRPPGMTWEVTSEDRGAQDSTAISKVVRLYFTGTHDGPKMDLRITLPNTRSPVPVFLVPGFAFPGPLLRCGYGVVSFNPNEVEPDRRDGYPSSIRRVFAPAGQAEPGPDEWGAIGAWAWAMSRAMDYLETDRDIDRTRVAIMGVSRYGKVVMWAGAQDERFAMVFSGESGLGGVVIARRGFGETVRSINGYAPHWFDGNFKAYGDRVADLPVDWHELVALIAPRPVYIATAERDYWGDQRGSFLAGKAAEPVYRLFGKRGLGVDSMPGVEVPVGDVIGFHNRRGSHGLNAYDWDRFLDFADRHFGRTPPPRTEARFDWFTYQGDDSVYHRQSAGAGQYLNPILAGFYPDPTICRQGDDFYLATSSFAYYPGVPLFTSRDLVRWTQVGHILSRPSQLNLDSAGVSRGIFAPSLSCRPGKLWMITTLVDRGGNFLVTTTNPAGFWSDPVWLGFDGIDPSLFFDDDGKVYIVHNGLPEEPQLYGQAHRAIWIQEYDTTARQLTGPHRMIVDGGVDISTHPIWIEAPHIFKKDGWYYLICAEGGTAELHSEVVFRSRSVWGPWVPGPLNPILTQRHLDPARPDPVWTAGHADFVETPNGEWWAVFLGTRPYEDYTFNIGRETFLLPVRWRDGWPVILEGNETVPYVAQAPDLAPDPRPGMPLSGNFTDRDDFDALDLRPTWTFLRTVREPWAETVSTPGWLTIQARPATLEGLGQPSFVARRQQHHWATATTAMRYRPLESGDEAGLAAFQSSDAWFLLGVTLVEGRPVIRLTERAGAQTQGTTAVLASASLEAPADSTLYLRIQARGGRYDFSYAYRPEEWVLLKGDVDGTILSTRVAGGFVGTMLGLYAHHDAHRPGSVSGGGVGPN
jgi:xylan 1,4-beta-xylosidase